MVRPLKILLVNPACLDRRISGEDAHIVPIGLYYIGAQLLDKGFSTRILNLAAAEVNNPLERFTQVITELQPDIIGFSVTNPNRWNAIDSAKIAREHFPSITVVFGGPAPTFLVDHLFEACPELDVIVIGEGEQAMLELAEHIEQTTADPAVAGGRGSFSAISGLVYRSNGSLVKTAPPVPIENLDALAHPSAHFTYQHLAMSRGCPGKCTFCGSPRFWGGSRVRSHSPQWFVDEIEALTAKGVTHFYLSDDTFTMDKTRVLEFCRRIRQKKLIITWNAISRVDYLDEELVFAMRTAGCIQISFGVESGSDAIRKKLGKPVDSNQILRAFSLTRSFGIMPRAYFIYGSPGETPATIADTLRMMDAIQPLSAVFYLLVIFPGTHLYQKAVARHKISDHIWHERIEDLPWFEVDDLLDFQTVKSFGGTLRSHFFSALETFVQTLVLVDKKELYPFHADFLSRLAMTFSHGEYANHPQLKNPDQIAWMLYEYALRYAPDARAFLGMAMLSQKRRQFHAAISTLEKALSIWPDNPDLMLCMGICQMNTGRFKTALEHLNPLASLPQAAAYINICHQHISGKPS